MTKLILPAVAAVYFILGWLVATQPCHQPEEEDTPIYILSEPGYEQFDGFDENQEAAMVLQRRLDKLKIKKLIGFIEEV